MMCFWTEMCWFQNCLFRQLIYNYTIFFFPLVIAVNGTLSVWVPVGAALGCATLFVCCNVVVLCLCVCYCSWCACCPCNRKRGRAQLVVTRKEGEMRNKDRFQTSNGVTMFVPPRLVNQVTDHMTCTHFFVTESHIHPKIIKVNFWSKYVLIRALKC